MNIGSEFPPLTSRFLRLGLILLGVLFGVAIAHAEAPAHRFEKDIAAFEAADAAQPPSKGAILFVGDSTFTKWKSIHEDLAGYTVINRGFGGSQMADLLYFVDRVVMPYRPRLIVVQEGGNDLHGGRTPEALLADIKSFVEKVQTALPGTPIVIGSLTPNPARWNEVETRRRANQMIKDYASTQKDVTYLNFFDDWLGFDGRPREELFIEDHLHPNALGYQLRVKIMRPVLGAPDQPPAKP
ncbi:MAG TPA: GDSL-type esterase/lipase family protein [Chthoniobacter sp.]|jgi:lysophospholipase L1-like esterase